MMNNIIILIFSLYRKVVEKSLHDLINGILTAWRMLMVKLLLIRHGETDYNVKKRLQGQMDTPLNTRGEEQAAVLGLFLENEPIDAVYSSPLKRAARTAEIIAALHKPALSVVCDPQLMEVDFGEWNGMLMSTIFESNGTDFRRWREDHDFAVPQGESINMLIQRMDGFRERFLADHPGQTVAVVAHGGVLQALIIHLMQMKPKLSWPFFRMENTSVTEIQVDKNSAFIERLNDISHLKNTPPGG
jgi:broad specificity phosphatase PhoE